jgi:conjugative transfer signal peptidase TraF
MKPDLRPIRLTLLVLCCFFMLQIIGGRADKIFWLNLVGSEPIGLYRLEKFKGELRRGDMVVMKVPAAFERYVYGRGWLPEGWSLFKHIGAVPGDFYCITGLSLTVNGGYVGPVYSTDSAGLSLPDLQGCYLIADSYFLPVATRIKNSFDGRYMGAVHVSEILGIARPIVTF